VLSQRAADFTTSVPSAEQVQDAYDAQVRLAALTNDPTWAKKFMAGSIPERQEFDALTQQIAAGADAGGGVGLPESEITLGTEGLKRENLISEISHLSAIGVPEAGIERILTADYPAESIPEAQALLDRNMATREWREALLASQLPQAIFERCHTRLRFRVIDGETHQRADHPHPLGLLRAQREWTYRRGAKRGNEFSPSDVDCHVTLPWGSCPAMEGTISRLNRAVCGCLMLRGQPYQRLGWSIE
jgi:hypothetical protein